MKQILFIALFIAIASAALPLFATNSQNAALADTKMLALADVGCKTASIDNLRNAGEANIPLMGVGDYMYNCNPGDIEEGEALEDYYAAIEDKVGAMGNHEIDRGQHEQWARETFQNDNGYQAWRLAGNQGELGIIVLDPYQDFDEGSDQFAFVEDKIDKFRTDHITDWIVFVVHEPMWTPTVEGGHGPNTAMRDVYEPVIAALPNAFLISAHNHATAFGKVGNINQAMCGGGGYGGDTLGKLNGWEWGTDDMGICSFNFKSNGTTIEGDFVGTDGQILKHFVWTR